VFEVTELHYSREVIISQPNSSTLQVKEREKRKKQARAHCTF